MSVIGLSVLAMNERTDTVNSTPDDLLTRKETAVFCKISERTLDRQTELPPRAINRAPHYVPQVRCVRLDRHQDRHPAAERSQIETPANYRRGLRMLSKAGELFCSIFCGFRKRLRQDLRRYHGYSKNFIHKSAFH